MQHTPHKPTQDLRQTAPAAAGVSLQRHAWRALGGPCEVQVLASPQAAREFFTEAVAWLEAFEAKYSRFRPGSLVSRINSAAGGDWVAIDGEAEAFFALGDAVQYLSRGVLDPTAGPLLRLWYGATTPPAAQAIENARRQVGWARVERRPGAIRLPAGMALDFGGYGKEYATDRLAALANQLGITTHLIDLGRDLMGRGAPPGQAGWHIGIEDPRQPGQVLGNYLLVDGGLAASGSYRKHFVHAGRRYGHILDPRTGWPVANPCLSTHVQAQSCLEAGILSTAAFILGPQEGLALIEGTFGAAGLIVHEGGIAATPAFRERYAGR